MHDNTLPVSDRRKHTRYKLNIPIILAPKTISNDAFDEIQVIAKNVSRNGIIVALDRYLAFDSIWNVHLNLNPDVTLDTEVRIVWEFTSGERNKIFCGMCFINLDKHEQSMLGEFLSDKSFLSEKLPDRRQQNRRKT